MFGKLFLSILFVLFLTAAMCGGVYLHYLASNGYGDPDKLGDSARFSAKQARDIADIKTYLTLKETAELTEDLTHEETIRLAELEKQLGISEPGNLLWQALDGKSGALLYSNLTEEDASLPEAVGAEKLEYTSFRSEIYGSDGVELLKQTEYTLVYGMRPGFPYADEYAQIKAQYASLQGRFWPVLVLLLAAGLLAALLFAFLVSSAGRSADGETAVLNHFDRVWVEVPLLGLLAALYFWLSSLLYTDYVLFVVSSVTAGFLLLITSMTIVRRVRAGQLYRTSLLQLLSRYTVAAVRHIHIVGRVVAAFLLYLAAQVVLITLIANAARKELPVFIFVMGNLSILALIVVIAMQYNRVKKGTEKMAEGDLGVVIHENEVPFFRQIAHNLNSSGSAIKAAVERATQSERMKSELITNVSHDIKTPLTSIINYVGLLRTTGITDPKALEYVDILEHKSKRLAQLMADLVEASKVTSGAVGVTMESINLGELVKQAGGEFESRFEEREIQLMCRLPEQPVLVYADGRHMWRVLDNLFSNAVKYALDGTRIYVDLADLGNEAVLSMKNISREPLNQHPDELMERFVRGDRARMGEGSGLGLSIARSLMELQNGTLDIQIDGDLFKAVLTLRKM